MRQIDHANAVAHRQLLGVGYLPKMPAVPFSYTLGYTITILCQQRRFVCLIAVGAFPASHFHKVTTQSNLTLIKGTGSQAPGGTEGFPGVDRRGVHLLCDFVTTIAHELVSLLNGIVPRGIHRMGIHRWPPVSHPVHQHLGGPGSILDPDRLAQPEVLDLGRFTDDGTTVRRNR